MPTSRRRPPTLADRLHAVAAALGVPVATATRVVAECVAWDDAKPPADAGVMLSDPVLLARLDAYARVLGVSAESLANLFVGIGLARREARLQGRRWRSNTTGPSRRVQRRSRPRQ